MNNTIIEKYNSVVNENDEIYCLGDCLLNDLEEGIRCIKNLKGQIHIIKGNHCTDTKVEAYKKCYNVVEVCDIKILKYSKRKTFYLSHYPTIVSNYGEEGRFFWNLSGHTHFTSKFYNDINKIYNVSVDAHNCYPVSIEQIISDINKREEELKGEK